MGDADKNLDYYRTPKGVFLCIPKNKNISSGELKERTTPAESSASASHEMAELKNQMLEMQMEIDILKETINVLKKDPGIDQTALSNREKAVITDALRTKYSLSRLLEKLNLAKSSYYYQEKFCLNRTNIFPYRYASGNYSVKIKTDTVTAGYTHCSNVKAPLYPKKLSAR